MWQLFINLEDRYLMKLMEYFVSMTSKKIIKKLKNLIIIKLGSIWT